MNDLKIKHVFLDMDGTLNPFECSSGQIDVKVFEPGFFAYKRPLYTVIWGLLTRFKDAEKYILSAVPVSWGYAEKNKWLDSEEIYSILPIKNENRYYTRFKVDDKVDVLLDIINRLGLNKEEVLLVDDEFKIIAKAENIGIRSMHPSTLAVDGEEYLIRSGLIDLNKVNRSLPTDDKVMRLKPKNNKRFISN